MSTPELVIRSRRIVAPEGMVDGAVVVQDGRILDVVHGEGPAAHARVDLAQAALLPAVVDCHAHINEPGRTEWEGFQTATRAAAAGGIAAIVDMPLNSVPATTTLSALETKAGSAAGQCVVDYGFWGGVIPGNANELEPMVAAGALGFKAFLIESGVEEFPHASREDLDAAMPILAKLGVPLLVHAELPVSEVPQDAASARRYQTYLRSRPPAWEVEAIRMMIDLCRRHRCRVHIVHLAAAEALPDIRRAKEDGLPFTVETCPHYLTFAAEEIPDGATWFKCAPPIRDADNREALWAGLLDGTIDFVVSDHSPCTPALKKLEAGDFAQAWGGIASLQFSLPAVWTGLRARGAGLGSVASLMAERTSAFIGTADRIGRIACGLEANFVAFDPDAVFEPTAADVLHRHPLTPYSGRRLHGRVRTTWLRGQPIFDGGRFPDAPRGRRLLSRPLPGNS